MTMAIEVQISSMVGRYLERSHLSVWQREDGGRSMHHLLVIQVGCELTLSRSQISCVILTPTRMR